MNGRGEGQFGSNRSHLNRPAAGSARARRRDAIGCGGRGDPCEKRTLGRGFSMDSMDGHRIAGEDAGVRLNCGLDGWRDRDIGVEHAHRHTAPSGRVIG